MNTQNTVLPRLCLTMMVKNEVHIIERCLDSIASQVDYWVICDTGSTDGTQKIIESYFERANIPGELHQHEWKDYGYNRTLTLQSAQGKADYLLLADADYIFHINNADFKQNLEADAYHYYNIGNTLKYKMLKMLKGDEEWCYIGVTHEYIECISKPDYTPETINDIHVEERYDGGNRGSKFDNDIKLLTHGLIDEPHNQRYMFYLARSYQDTQQYESAIKYYQMRIDEGGWEEETFYSYYSITCCLIHLERPLGEIMEAALRGYQTRPTRLESLYELIRYCRLHEHYQIGYLLGQSVVHTAFPVDDGLFVHKAIYEWMLKDEVSICAHHVGAHREALNLITGILNCPQIPQDSRKRIEKNATFSKEKL